MKGLALTERQSGPDRGIEQMAGGGQAGVAQSGQGFDLGGDGGPEHAQVEGNDPTAGGGDQFGQRDKVVGHP